MPINDTTYRTSTVFDGRRKQTIIRSVEGKTFTDVASSIESDVNNNIGSFQITFTNSDLVANVFTFSHPLNTEVVTVSVYDNNNVEIVADVDIVSSSSISIDLTGLTPITGTYRAVVQG